MVSSLNPSRIRLFLVEDQLLFSSLLLEVLETDSRFSVIGSAPDGSSAIAALASVQPDLVIVDLLLPDMSGLELIDKIKKTHPGTRVVVCSAATHDDAIAMAFALGADGFVEKTTGLAELFDVLHKAAAGIVSFTPRVSEVLRRRVQSDRSFQSLQVADLVFLRRFAQHFSAKETAEELGCSLSALYKVRRRIAAVIGAKSRSDFELAAIHLGLVPARVHTSLPAIDAPPSVEDRSSC